jgi:hypothetical protein
MPERFRHEDVSAVPSGWKVRTVKHRDHRVRVAFPPGRRHVGSGRLVSILHPAGENPCSMRSSNPAELMIMGANPPRKRNAETKEAREKEKVRAALLRLAEKTERQGYHHLAKEYREAAERNPSKLELQRHTRERAGRIRAARHNPAKVQTYQLMSVITGKPIRKATKVVFPDGREVKFIERLPKRKAIQAAMQQIGRNPAELLVMGANPRVEVVHSDNPPVETIVEEFSGAPAEWIDVYNEPHMTRGRYAQLGPLIALYVKPAGGGQVRRIGAPESRRVDWKTYWNGDPPVIVTDHTARCLYFVGGNQDLTDCLEGFGARDRGDGVLELGTCRRIDYEGRKEHVADPDEDQWKHDHGEENGVLPTVLFDTRNKRLLYEGGDYRIDGAWIRN